MITAFLTTATTVATSYAIEMFISGVCTAMSLYCGTKLPKNKRTKND